MKCTVMRIESGPALAPNVRVMYRSDGAQRVEFARLIPLPETPVLGDVYELTSDQINVLWLRADAP